MEIVVICYFLTFIRCYFCGIFYGFKHFVKLYIPEIIYDQYFVFRRKAIILITCRRPHSTPVVHIICTRMRAKKKSTRCEKRMSAMLVCFA